MRKFLILLLALFFGATAARADYPVRDGNGNLIIMKSQPVGPGQVPQSVPTDPAGTPYSPTNAMPAAPPRSDGHDISGNPPSLSGLTLLQTIHESSGRVGFDTGCNCAAGMYVVLDDDAGTLTPTIVPINGPSADGLQGGNYTTEFHSGRIRIYSSDGACQYWARQWP